MFQSGSSMEVVKFVDHIDETDAGGVRLLPY
jgi:hypothetical protein